jgi:streptogramin lyase
VLFLRASDARLFEPEHIPPVPPLTDLPAPEPPPEPEPRPPPEPRPEPTPVPRPPPPSRWRKLLPWAAAAVALLAAAALAAALLRDGEGDEIPSVIPVGSAPIDLVVTAGSVWTSNQAGGDISEVDPATGEEVDRIHIAPDPGLSGIAAGFDSLWIANVQTNQVVRVAPGTEDTTPIDFEGRPSAIAFGAGRMWVTIKTEPAQLVELDPNTNQTGRQFMVAGQPEDIKFARGALWVTSASTKNITRVTPDGTTEYISIGAASDDAAVGAGALWVANPSVDRITRIALGQPTSQKKIRVGRRPEGIAADDRNVWVVNQGDNSVTRIDAHDPDRILGRYKVGENPTDVAIDDAGVAWVVNKDDNTLSRIEP